MLPCGFCIAFKPIPIVKPKPANTCLITFNPQPRTLSLTFQPPFGLQPQKKTET
jgi:hypothetical protein